MPITLLTPAPPGSRHGNRVTALRWARMLRSLGHKVVVTTPGTRATPALRGASAHTLIALHAHRSNAQIVAQPPDTRVIVVCTGTDIYPAPSPEALESLHRADTIVVLHERMADPIPPELRHKVVVIHQSAEPVRNPPKPREGAFEVCVLGHLRAVKDPFLAAQAARLANATSRLHIYQAGGAMDPGMDATAREETARNERYTWLGELTRPQALRLLCRSRLLVLTSKAEGAPSVFSEALANGIPILSTRIPVAEAMLGDDYPGLFPIADAPALAALLQRAESEPGFLEELRSQCARAAHLVEPARERAALAALTGTSDHPSPQTAWDGPT